jgi:anthranilate phosphoribosyltransferase
MEDLKPLLNSVAQGNSLTREEARTAFEIMMSGQATEAQIGAFLMALRVRGETVEEITAGAEIMREKALKIDAPANAIDTCGTGGDASGSYNVSTAVSLVVAACGVPVAKHGNRALSSRAGAADVLKSLGVNIEAEPAQVAACIREAGVGFLFAPRHHSAMRHVGPARAQLGTRTIFNLLGPLSNPAGTKRQIVGVFADKWVRPMAEVLKQLGSEAAWVVHGLDGLDEITTTGPTHVAELKDGEIQEFEVTPEEAGLARAMPDQLKGGDAETNALALSALVDGHEGPYRDIVLLNSAAALIVAGKADNLILGVKMAAAAIDAGGARKALDTLVRVSNLDIEPAEASARA